MPVVREWMESGLSRSTRKVRRPFWTSWPESQRKEEAPGHSECPESGGSSGGVSDLGADFRVGLSGLLARVPNRTGSARGTGSQTPSLPGPRPLSDRSRCTGRKRNRKRNFLADRQRCLGFWKHQETAPWTIRVAGADLQGALGQLLSQEVKIFGEALCRGGVEECGKIHPGSETGSGNQSVERISKKEAASRSFWRESIWVGVKLRSGSRTGPQSRPRICITAFPAGMPPHFRKTAITALARA